MGFLDSKIITNGDRQVLQMPNSVNFMIITKDKYMILGSQKRAGNDMKDTLNLLGGYVDEKEDSSESLLRELYEETNLREEDIKETVKVLYSQKYVSVGYTTEKNSLYIVRTKKKLKDLDLKCNDESENIKLEFIKLNRKNIRKLKESNGCLKLDYCMSYLESYVDNIRLLKFLGIVLIWNILGLIFSV